jgi:peptidoglycan/LPS O-acetylase OafA/YrhL
MQSRKVGDIQVLRAVAILFVLAQHQSLTTSIRDLLPFKVNMPFWIGVELFFVISGLVVTQSVINSPLAPFKFIFRRAFRLIPAMLLFFVFSGLVSLIATTMVSNDWASRHLSTTASRFLSEALAILGGYFINIQGPTLYVNGAMWSLSVEFQFYATFAAVVGALCVLRLASASAKSILLAAATALYLAVLVQRIGILTGHDLLQNPMIAYIRAWRMDFMLLGVIVATLPLRRFSSGAWFSPCLLIVPLIVVSLSEGVLDAGPKPMLHGFATPLIGISFAALLYLARSDSAFAGKERSGYRALTWTGDRSYSLYLLHFPVMAMVWILYLWFAPWVFSGPITYGFAQAMAAIPLASIAAHFSFEYVERPAQRLGQRLLRDISVNISATAMPEHDSGIAVKT